MSTHTNKIFSYYEDYTARNGEDNRATESRSNSLEFHYTKQALAEHINSQSRVLEVGCGTGYYGMYFADKCKEYVGIDLFPHHIEIFQRKINESGHTNLSCQVGDATKLDGIADSSFDVVCCLGPMYHLPPEMRELVFAECKRVCRPGGIIAFAYVNKLGVYVGACVHDEGRSIYPNRETNDAVFKHGISDERPGVFFFSMPEEMEAAATRHSLTKICNIGTDSFITRYVVDKMDDEKFALYMEIADELVKHESCTGMSNHALIICRKN